MQEIRIAVVVDVSRRVLAVCVGEDCVLLAFPVGLQRSTVVGTVTPI